jgi:excisionase family DNA binding protein
MTDKILTADEAAARLRVSRGTIYNLLRSGQLQGYRLPAPKRGGRWLIKESDLEAFLSKGGGRHAGKK